MMARMENGKPVYPDKRPRMPYAKKSSVQMQEEHDEEWERILTNIEKRRPHSAPRKK